MSDDQGKVEDRPKRNDLPARAAKRIVATIFARSSFKADDPKYDPMIPLADESLSGCISGVA
jgi:hypothetical protein